jgi:hypothetical protein
MLSAGQISDVLDGTVSLCHSKAPFYHIPLLIRFPNNPYDASSYPPPSRGSCIPVSMTTFPQGFTWALCLRFHLACGVPTVSSPGSIIRGSLMTRLDARCCQRIGRLKLLMIPIQHLTLTHLFLLVLFIHIHISAAYQQPPCISGIISRTYISSTLH